MSKRIDCESCKNMYDCEHTYLGGCTDGEEWASEPVEEAKEQKLTDEEAARMSEVDNVL